MIRKRKLPRSRAGTDQLYEVQIDNMDNETISLVLPKKLADLL